MEGSGNKRLTIKRIDSFKDLNASFNIGDIFTINGSGNIYVITSTNPISYTRLQDNIYEHAIIVKNILFVITYDDIKSVYNANILYYDNNGEVNTCVVESKDDICIITENKIYNGELLYMEISKCGELFSISIIPENSTFKITIKMEDMLYIHFPNSQNSK